MLCYCCNEEGDRAASVSAESPYLACYTICNVEKKSSLLSAYVLLLAGTVTDADEVKCSWLRAVLEDQVGLLPTSFVHLFQG